MTHMMLTVGGIAASILIVVVGVQYFDRGERPNIGGAGPTSRPTVTATAMPIATVSPEPDALPTSGLTEPGRYFVEVEGYRYIFTVVGSGWESDVLLDETFLRKDAAQESEEFGLLLLIGGVGPSEVIYAHPCDPELTIDPGHTVDDFASALEELDFYDTLEPTDVSFSGYQGKRVRMFSSNFTTCINPDVYPNFDGAYRTWDGRDHKPHEWPSFWLLNYDVRILDLDGMRHLFYTAHKPGPGDETETFLNQIVASMEIEKANR
jgi:hypothetical protein